jgi:hypothetical protein
MTRNPQASSISASLLGLVLAFGAVVAEAAIISDINATWPTSPAVQTVDALSVTNGNRGMSGTRINRQSFSVASDFTVGEIYLSANNYGNTAFKLEFFEIINVLQGTGNGGLAGAANVVGQVDSTITVVPQGTTATGLRNLRIALSPAEQFNLPALPSPGGYLVAISLVDSASAAAFNWVHSNTGADVYSGGRYRRDDGDQTNTRDYGLALVAAIPEPDTALVLLSGVLCVAAVRRQRPC